MSVERPESQLTTTTNRDYESNKQLNRVSSEKLQKLHSSITTISD
ncbi:hypothetical protein [Levilactobacillus cerevisiae]